MGWNNPKRCPKCGKYFQKARGAGYIAAKDEHTYFILGWVCWNCKIVYLNKDFGEFDLDWISFKDA